MSRELYNAAEAYAKAFGDNFPLYLFRDLTESKIMALINQCITEHKTAEEIMGRQYTELADY